VNVPVDVFGLLFKLFVIVARNSLQMLYTRILTNSTMQIII
jgi:hypothetical protein